MSLWYFSIVVDMAVTEVFTNRVRSTMEGYVFTGFCLLTGGRGGWGYPKIPSRPPSQVRTGGGQGTPSYLSPWTGQEEGKGYPQGTYPPWPGQDGEYP